MSWELKIKRVKNGFIVTGEDDSLGRKHWVFQEDEEIEDREDVEAVKDMLYFIMDYFGISYSKHNKKNLLLVVEHQTENIDEDIVRVEQGDATASTGEEELDLPDQVGDVRHPSA